MNYRKANGFARLKVALLGLGLCQLAAGATLCVNQHGTSGCSATIGAAVAAASSGDVVQVSAGTYHEDVAIGKAISLIADDHGNVIIDATGMANGITITGVSGALVSGFTVENANYEGILLNQASQITVTNNRVLKNDVSLDINTDTCAGIAAFETSEGFDCGEGIHLSGVDHSIVSNNLVEDNAGGILLSDDTGATHDNLIMGNTVLDNPFDCGITLASHPLYTTTPGPPTAAGVYHNTINGNTSKHNGFQVPGAGAGVGLFSPAPFTATWANVVVNNTLIDNGQPGVSMHAHAPGATLADNVIAGNYISNNAQDTADTATSGPTGINVSGGDNGSGVPLAVITGTLIAGNTIQHEAIGIAAKTNALVAAHLNTFTDVMTGVDNIAGSLPNSAVDARLDWWGCPKGPGSPGCANIVGGNVLYMPFLTGVFPFSLWPSPFIF